MQTQQPKRLLPQEGVDVSITSGHSPAGGVAVKGAPIRWLLPPHGDGTCSRYVQISCVVKSATGA